jgi:hypothetical protein
VSHCISLCTFINTTPAFRAPDLDLARTQWLHELTRRLNALEAARELTTDELEYGGAGAHSLDVGPLEAAVDEARRMVCSLGGEIRRRSEGSLPVWLGVQTIAATRTVSAGV